MIPNPQLRGPRAKQGTRFHLGLHTRRSCTTGISPFLTDVKPATEQSCTQDIDLTARDSLHTGSISTNLVPVAVTLADGGLETWVWLGADR